MDYHTSVRNDVTGRAGKCHMDVCMTKVDAADDGSDISDHKPRGRPAAAGTPSLEFMLRLLHPSIAEQTSDSLTDCRGRQIHDVSDLGTSQTWPLDQSVIDRFPASIAR